MITLQPQGHTPSQACDLIKIHGWLTDSEWDRRGREHHRMRRALRREFETQLLCVECSGCFQVTDLESKEIRSKNLGHSSLLMCYNKQSTDIKSAYCYYISILIKLQGYEEGEDHARTERGLSVEACTARLAHQDGQCLRQGGADAPSICRLEFDGRNTVAPSQKACW